MTTPTTNPVPSQDPQDLLFNAEKLDEIVSSSALQYTDRLGQSRRTAAGALASFTALNPRGAWATATAYAPRDLASNSGTWYIALDSHISGATFSGDSAAHWRPFQGVLPTDLASTTDALKGAGQLGYAITLGYSVGTVGRRLIQEIHISDFDDGVRNHSQMLQAAVDRAAVVIGSTAAFLAPGADIVLGPGPYTFTAKVNITQSGIGIRGQVGRGSYITGDVDFLDIGDYTNTLRVRCVELAWLNFQSSVTNSTKTAVKVYRAIEFRMHHCTVGGMNVGVDCVRASTAYITENRFANGNRTTQAQASIRLYGTDESTFASPSTSTPGGGIRILHNEAELSSGTVDTLCFVELHSVDTAYILNNHVTGAVESVSIVPDATAANRTILDVWAIHNYFDEPSTFAASPAQIRIGGTVKESITLASGATASSIYESIHFFFNRIRGANESDYGVIAHVTDGDSWFDGVRQLRAIEIEHNDISQHRIAGVRFYGASNSPTDTYVEARETSVSRNFLSGNGVSNPIGIGSCITMVSDDAIIDANVCGAQGGTSDYLISITCRKTGDDFTPSAIARGNNFFRATGYTIEPLNIAVSEVGSMVLRLDNIYPGARREIREPYSVQTTNATPTVAWSYVLPQGTGAFLRIAVVGCITDGTGSKFIGYEFTGFVRRNAGGTTISGGAFTVAGSWNPDTFGTVPTLTVVGNTITLTVTGIAATVIDWSSYVDAKFAR